jgi:hypothetical protein
MKLPSKIERPTQMVMGRAQQLTPSVDDRLEPGGSDRACGDVKLCWSPTNRSQYRWRALTSGDIRIGPGLRWIWSYQQHVHGEFFPDTTRLPRTIVLVSRRSAFTDVASAFGLERQRFHKVLADDVQRMRIGEPVRFLCRRLVVMSPVGRSLSRYLRFARRIGADMERVRGPDRPISIHIDLQSSP